MKSRPCTFAWLAAAAAALLPALLYLPTLSYGFVFDDRPLLIDNPVIQDPQGMREIFTTDLDPQARLAEAPTTNYLRPLFLAFAAGLHEIAGANPRGWHWAALLLHGLLCFAAFLALRGEGLGPGRALAAALVFGCHPAHVQSAAWVAGMQDLLFGVFALAAYLAYRKSARRPAPEPARLGLLTGLYALALLAKEPAVGLLLFVAAEALFFARLPPAKAAGESAGRRPWAELATLAAVTLAYFGYRAAVLGGLAHRFPTAPPWPAALASVPVAILAYLRDLLFPVDLFLLHAARPVASWPGGPALLAALGLAAAAAAALWACRRRAALGRPLLFFAAWLAPSLAIWAINPEWMVMDRYLLLPSLALGWALAVAVPSWEGGAMSIRPSDPGEGRGEAYPLGSIASPAAEREVGDPGEGRGEAPPTLGSPPSPSAERGAGGRGPFPISGQRGPERAFLAAGVLLIAALAALSLRDMRDYRDETSFWNAAIAADPGSATAHTEWARLRSEAGDLAAAEGALERAIALDPQAQLPRLRRALLLLRRDRTLAATVELEELTRRNPGYLPAWRNLVVARSRLGDAAGSLAALERALELFPNDPLLWTHRAVLLRGAGRPEEALGALRRAAALAPGDAVLVLREALLLAELGRRGEAAEAARRGLALGPAAEIRAQLEALAR